MASVMAIIWMTCRVFANAERMGSVDFCALRPMWRAFG